MKIIDTDVFLEMPATAQNLYFHLNIRADDEGFVGNPKKILKMVNASEDDLKVLLGKRFVLGFASGVLVIKHWKIHNWIRNDRLNPTTYRKELETLTTNEYGAYTEKMSDKYLTNVSQVTDKCPRKLNKIKLNKNKVESPPVFKHKIYSIELSPKQYHTLKDKYGKEAVRWMIVKLSSYKEQEGKSYRSDYGAMNNWVKDAWINNQKRLGNDKGGFRSAGEILRRVPDKGALERLAKEAER